MASRASIEVHALHVGFRDEGFVVGELGPVCIAIWRGEVTAERFGYQRAALLDVAERYRPNAAFMCLVEEGATPPGPELRRASAEMMEAVNGLLCCAPMVVEGTGFRGAVVRSVLSGMQLLMSHHSYPVATVASAREAGVWMSKHLPLAPKTFERDVEELRSKMPRTSLRSPRT